MSTMYRLDQLVEDPDNIRSHYDPDKLQELADSIDSFGLINPLSVVVDAENQVVIKAGHRRYRAMQLLVAAKKLESTTEVPCDVWEPTDEAFSTTLMLIENLQREDISALDEARGFMTLASVHKLKQKDIAKRIGKSQGHVSKRMALLNLPDPIQDQVALGKVALDVAYELAQLPPEHPAAAKLLKTYGKDPAKVMSWELDSVKRTIDVDKKLAAFNEALTERLLTTVAKRPEDSQLYDIQMLATLEELAAYVPAKHDILVRTDKEPRVFLYRKLTAAQLKAREKKQAIAEAEHRAGLTPYDAWCDEVERLDDEHEAISDQINVRRDADLAKLVTGMANKDLLRAAVEHLQTTTFSSGQAYRVLNMLGINFLPADTPFVSEWKHYDEAAAAFKRWLAEDPATHVLQAVLLLQRNGASMVRLLAEVNLTHPLPELVLPPEPWQMDDGTWTTEPRPRKDDDTAVEADIADAVADAVATLDHDPTPEELEAIEQTVRQQLAA